MQSQLFQALEPEPVAQCPGGCVLAIVGSIKLDRDPDAAKIIEALFDLHRPRHFVSGGARGVDLMAEAAADRRSVPKSIHLPFRRTWPYFKARDLLIAEQAECLVRVFSGAATTYGSGWTANQAEKRGARVWRIKVGEGPARF